MGTTSSKNCSIEDDYRSRNAFLAAGKFGKIELDYRSINALLVAAKFGKWDEVWDIIGTPDKPRKAYLLNSIPAESRWSVLHQAVFWKDKAVIETLLKFDTCDSGVKAKKGTCEVGPAGRKTPMDVAKQFNYNDIATLLEGHNCKLLTQELPTFHSQKHILENDGPGLFHITIAAYKDAFHPSPIFKGVQELMPDIFKHVNYKDNWKHVMDKISQPLYQVYEDGTSKLELCKTKKEFFGKIMNVYSYEDIRLYTLINTALRRQMRRSYMPTADDLAIGPYTLMFNLLLLNWDAVKEETKTTYRCMNLTAEDSVQYKPGIVFVWISVVSSSLVKSKASAFPTSGPRGDMSVLFEIDNSAKSPWRPRNIEKFAQYDERERVYPAGSIFKVVRYGIENKITIVHLKLLGSMTHGEQVHYINPDSDMEYDTDSEEDDE